MIKRLQEFTPHVTCNATISDKISKFNLEFIPQENKMTILHLKDGTVAGMLLGDSNLSKTQKRIEFKHTVPQLNWLKFKLGLMEQFGYSARLFKLTKTRTNLGIYEYCSGTASGLDISKFYSYGLYNLLNQLNPLGLLIWWCDDGCLSIHQKQNGSISRFGYLNSQGFSLEENQLISSVLYQKFGLETKIHVDSKSGLAKQDHYRLYLNATNMRRLIDLVREFIPWIPNNMRYKFNMQYVVNRRKDSLEMAMHYNF